MIFQGVNDPRSGWSEVDFKEFWPVIAQQWNFNSKYRPSTAISISMLSEWESVEVLSQLRIFHIISIFIDFLELGYGSTDNIFLQLVSQHWIAIKLKPIVGRITAGVTNLSLGKIQCCKFCKLTQHNAQSGLEFWCYNLPPNKFAFSGCDWLSEKPGHATNLKETWRT